MNYLVGKETDDKLFFCHAFGLIKSQYFQLNEITQEQQKSSSAPLCCCFSGCKTMQSAVSQIED